MKLSKYLLCYFTGNEPDEERIRFALSEDGYRFEAVNNGEPVIIQKLGKRCCRDPFIFRDEDNRFHILATDMKSSEGWNSNNSIVIWDSDDLVNWENERVIDFTQFDATKTADRVWAPEAIFDSERGEYMLYWSHSNADDDLPTVCWYVYTKDFVTFTTEPKLLFAPRSGMAAIDADIIKSNGRYYMYVADEYKDRICLVTSDSASGEYCEPQDNAVSVADVSLEGNCIYRILGSDKYVMIADRFKNGGYFMQESTDLVHFTAVSGERYALDHLKPRHSSVMHITDEEYDRIKSANARRSL